MFTLWSSWIRYSFLPATGMFFIASSKSFSSIASPLRSQRSDLTGVLCSNRSLERPMGSCSTPWILKSVSHFYCLKTRLQRWYITIPSSDQWCTTIENHRYQWLSYPKTIGKPLIPMVALNHYTFPSAIQFNNTLCSVLSCLCIVAVHRAAMPQVEEAS